MNNITMLILSCDKFSDLWDGHVKQLETYWPDREMRTIIVTDKPTDRVFPQIEIMPAGDKGAWSDRLAYAVQNVATDYVFVTLDDYFLVKRVENKQIEKILAMMDKEHIDYVRLFARPKAATREMLANYEEIHKIDTSVNYSVNLYSGVWRKKFLASTVIRPKTAWQFEVLLHKRAEEYGANCVVSLRNEFEILDVVRKGKLLHNAVAYFKKHPGIYTGNREVNTWEYEIKLGIQTLASRYLPEIMKKHVKAFMTKRGKKFFSDEAE